MQGTNTESMKLNEKYVHLKCNIRNTANKTGACLLFFTMILSRTPYEHLIPKEIRFKRLNTWLQLFQSPESPLLYFWFMLQQMFSLLTSWDCRQASLAPALSSPDVEVQAKCCLTLFCRMIGPEWLYKWWLLKQAGQFSPLQGGENGVHVLRVSDHRHVPLPLSILNRLRSKEVTGVAESCLIWFSLYMVQLWPACHGFLEVVLSPCSELHYRAMFVFNALPTGNSLQF